ncbi:SDR family oxidoreductase [Vibrio sp. ZSDE26]|uniref:SDR family oxidoreductase n=1 Tax=Vibrio amylolyticus TaxID=2847292 RepID=A0A9X1XJX9_9VIBR|nr:SDR family oxidoreductase [Vibrio amylolyticus]MCK6263238.1 SDR family oxidoreductase [Vibrio amylolyticus]
MKLLVTGSSGFVGQRLYEMAMSSNLEVCQVKRDSTLTQKWDSKNGEIFIVSSISSKTNWDGAFEGVDCVVHCAARVHQMKESKTDAIEAYREINAAGTLNLAQQAEKAGVRRFIFLSSIKVNGEFTKEGNAFQPDLESIPNDPYGLSKYEAEIGLKALAKETGFEVVIIRPPLVYGEGVKANFENLMSIIRKGLPLPLGAIHNQRSLVFRDNLVDLILLCCQHPKAVGETFLVADEQDVSTTGLIELISKAMNRPNRLLPIPMSWIKLGAKLIGKPQISQRICSNLQVDMSNTQKLLGWKPKISTQDGVNRAVQAFLKSNS